MRVLSGRSLSDETLVCELRGKTIFAVRAGAMRNFFVMTLLIGVCLLGACTRKINVEINSIAERGEMQSAGSLAGQRCLVLPAKADVRLDDLQFREFSAQVSASLAQRGCTPAQGLENADFVVLLHYGIGEPVIVEEHSYVMYRPWGRWSRRMPDYIPVMTTYIFNTCSLSLEARLVEKAAVPPGEAKKGGAASRPKAEEGAKLGKQLWKIDASHVGQRADLRALFPWLLTAAKEYYGVDSGQTVLVRVSEEDLASASLPEKNIALPPGAGAPESM